VKPEAAPGRSAAGAGARLRDELAEKGYAHREVGGWSMFPTLRRGDLVRVEPVGRLRRGDVAVFELCGALVVHRVVSVGESGVVCRGDAYRSLDPPIPRQDVFGAATVALPGRRLRAGAAGLAAARLRACEYRWRRRGRGTIDDLALLRDQRRGRVADSSPIPGGLRDPAERGNTVLGPDLVGGLLGWDGTPADGGLVPAFPREDPGQTSGRDDPAAVEVPAGVYGALLPDERRRLLAALAGRRVVVWGHLAHARRLALTRAVRRLTAALGHAAGEPGDAAVRSDPTADWRRFHFFTAAELVAELAAGGGRELESSVVERPPVRFVRASAQL